jgi:hypothetical protein
MTLYETGARKAIDDYLLAKSKEKRNYGDYWSASSAGYCMRKVIFDRLKVPPVKEDARKQRIFEVGHVFHEWAQRITKDAGVSIAQEEELIDEKIMVKGHFDDIVKGADGPILIDYKSSSSYSFKYKKDKPSHYHTMQLGTYMYMLRKQPRFKDLKEARITLISKDDLRMKDQQLLWSAGLEKIVFQYWSTLNSYWKNKQIPKCTCADYEINDRTGVGFMASESYNPYFYDGEPCSLQYLKKCKQEGLVDW